MADDVLLEPYTYKCNELFRINSGATRFRVKGDTGNLWLIAKTYPYRELYEISIGPLCKIQNLQSNEEVKISFRDIINSDHFTEFWVSLHNFKIRFGYTGQHVPLLELDCDDADYHSQIGFIKFNSPGTRHVRTTWIVEAPPIIYTSPTITRKHIDGGELYWTPMASPRLPRDAMIGGFEKEPTYIARALHNQSLCPGRYIPSKCSAVIPWGFREHRKLEFEILCGFDAEWVKTEGNNIPPNAFVAGYSEVRREPLYIGRAMYDGHLLTGKVHVLYNSCYLPYKGREVAVTSYEILVLADGERHTIFDQDE